MIVSAIGWAVWLLFVGTGFLAELTLPAEPVAALLGLIALVLYFGLAIGQLLAETRFRNGWDYLARAYITSYSAHASDMIHEAVMAIEFAAIVEDVARAFHAHPTLPEALKEAALAVDKRAIHG